MIAPKDCRCVAGVMSGTSLDGVDVVIAKIEGHGRDLRIASCYGDTYPFPSELCDILNAAANQEEIGVAALSQLNVRLAYEYAQKVRHTMKANGDEVRELDLVGCHGQTIRHLPDKVLVADEEISSTLQIGDPATMAQLLGVPVIGDFRLADMACGGQGAPLVPYFDYVVFTHDTESRGCLNIGGVANLTILPPNAQPDQVYGFDTGPGNMIIDVLCRRTLGVPYDEGGRIAKSGTVHEFLLAESLRDPFIVSSPPKSTGREYLSHAFLQRFLDHSKQLSPEDLIATATALTAASVWQSYESFIQPHHSLDRLIVSGGGVHNQTLLEMLRDYFMNKLFPVHIESSNTYGIDADGKEALCFAVLAHETADGIPTSIPSVTGATRAAVLGKLCVP
ncbi:MAG: anhydro-N-acetylmuramic acid kinase [Bacteroidetes bacterium]|nr:anhydro-N-acetylmuramic acid kinase [Bacteroidota bacterium]MCY4205186.1 anhydro-N-acetylmuramic acid kinase [Bacteroidota bacterium]